MRAVGGAEGGENVGDDEGGIVAVEGDGGLGKCLEICGVEDEEGVLVGVEDEGERG